MSDDRKENLTLLDSHGQRHDIVINWRANSPHIEYAMWVDDALIGKHGVVAHDVFEALCKLRSEIEPLGYSFLCFGAQRNAWPSAMARDMGQGLKAYELAPSGGPPLSLRGIFEPISADVVTTVQVQKKVCRELIEASLR